MALKFTNAASNRVVLDAGLDNENTYTVLIWARRTADVTFRSPWAKGGGSATPVRKFLDTWASVDQIAFRGSKRTTTNAEAISNTGAFPLNTWMMIACTYDSSDGPRIFTGTLTAEAAEISYASRTAGSGTEEDDSDQPWLIGQGDNIDQNGSFPGEVAIFAHFRRRMTLAEIVAWQFAPYSDADCDIFMELGYNGTGTQPNLTSLGNGINGTVTGATVVDHVPILSAFRRTQPAPATRLASSLVSMATDLALTLTSTAALRRRAKAASSSAFTLDSTAPLHRTANVAAALALTLDRAATLRRTANAATSMALSLVPTASLHRRAKAATSLALTFGSSAALTVGGAVTLALDHAVSFVSSATMRRKARAASSLPLTLDSTATPHRRANAAASTALVLQTAATMKRRAYAAASLALTLTVGAALRVGVPAVAAATTRTGITLARIGRTAARIARTGRTGVDL